MTPSGEYAAALFSLAEEQALTAEVQDGLHLVRQVLAETDGYLDYLASPAVPKQTRIASFRTFEGQVPECVISFLSVMLMHGRARLIPDTISEYDRLCDLKYGIVRAVATTAVPMPESRRRTLEAALEARTGKDVQIQYVTDPSVLGGIRIEMDGVLMDGTVQGRLKQLKNVMEQS